MEQDIRWALSFMTPQTNGYHDTGNDQYRYICRHAAIGAYAAGGTGCCCRQPPFGNIWYIAMRFRQKNETGKQGILCIIISSHNDGIQALCTLYVRAIPCMETGETCIIMRDQFNDLNNAV